MQLTLLEHQKKKDFGKCEEKMQVISRGGKEDESTSTSFLPFSSFRKAAKKDEQRRRSILQQLCKGGDRKD
jgi:hypothetical protein